VEDGQVTVNGELADDPGLVVGPSDVVVWDPNTKVRRRVGTALQVLYEDDDTIAVMKPAGLLTHPTEAKEKDTLQSRVSTYVARRHKGRPYLAVVHRIDKETSGCLVFAKSRRALTTLQAQLRAHSMDRAYVAIVEGDLSGERGTYDRELSGDGTTRKRGVAAPGEKGIRAVTEWRVVERFGIATLVEARLKTGRTHQIRIHFAFAGHPLVGDTVYHDLRRPPFPVPFPRQALHAGRLGWTGPDGVKRLVEAPPPSDFQHLLEALRRRSGGKKP
jgi:23S rRNA pseudouridine1911/1915/1917 synthase